MKLFPSLLFAVSAFSVVATVAGCSSAGGTESTDDTAAAESTEARGGGGTGGGGTSDAGNGGGSTCTSTDVKTVADVSKYYTELVADEAATTTAITQLIADISAQAGSSVITADLEAASADCTKLDTDSTTADGTVSLLKPTNPSVLTTQADGDKMFTDTENVAGAAVAVFAALASANPSGLKGYEGQLQALLASFEALAPDYTKVATDLASTTCGSKG